MSRTEKIVGFLLALMFLFSLYKLVHGQEIKQSNTFVSPSENTEGNTLPLRRPIALPTYDYRLGVQFRNVWKLKTAEVIQLHLASHRNCLARKLLVPLSMTNLYVALYPDNIRATAAPADNTAFATIFVTSNPKITWSEQQAVGTIIHESLHNAKICGNDLYKSPVPICNLWGKQVFYSSDIIVAIHEHFKSELSQLSTEEFK